MTQLPDSLTRQATTAWEMSSAVIAQIGRVICQCRGMRCPTGMRAARASRFLCVHGCEALRCKRAQREAQAGAHETVNAFARMARKLSATGAT